MLADVVNDLFELAVEFKSLGDKAVMGARQGDSGLGAAGDDDQVVRGDFDDEFTWDTLTLNNFDTSNAFYRRKRWTDTSGATWQLGFSYSWAMGGFGCGFFTFGFFHGGVVDWWVGGWKKDKLTG